VLCRVFQEHGRKLQEILAGYAKSGEEFDMQVRQQRACTCGWEDVTDCLLAGSDVSIHAGLDWEDCVRDRPRYNESRMMCL
jgi:hypothetical protein